MVSDGGKHFTCQVSVLETHIFKEKSQEIS